MTPDSFSLGNPAVEGSINSFDAWGIKCIHHHMLSPEKRRRREQIPFRDGTYDFGFDGDDYYNDRPLQVWCRLTRKITEDELDEIRYGLSRRNNIYFWDRPTKYYTAKLYDAIPITVFQQEIMRDFELLLLCSPPFAIGPQVTQDITNGHNPINFPGTARTPTLLIIKNPNPYAVTNVTITAARRIN